MDLKEISKPIQKDLEEFNDYFKNLLKTDVALLTLVLKYLTSKKGKQIRPILVFLSAGLCGKVNQRSFVGAAMIELLHTATLVHDDVVDQATVRRGIASINSEWNNKIAVLVGDFLLSLGLQTSVKNDEFRFLKITSQAVQLMSESELMAIDKSKKFSITEENYFKIINGKTASLISSCCEIGAFSSSNSEKDSENLRDFGTYLGLAFQIRDDLLDYVSKSSLIGKPVGNDIKEKKITLPLIYALSNADNSKQKEIIKLIKSDKIKKDEINYIMDFVKKMGGVKYSQDKAKEYCGQAKNFIMDYPESEYKTSLINLTDFVIDRIS
jgi:octaprenyl-diphosphate synthase